MFMRPKRGYGIVDGEKIAAGPTQTSDGCIQEWHMAEKPRNRAYEIQPGDMFTVTTWGLLNMTIEEVEKAAEYDIEIAQFWADGSITFMRYNYDETTLSL